MAAVTGQPVVVQAVAAVAAAALTGSPVVAQAVSAAPLTGTAVVVQAAGPAALTGTPVVARAVAAATPPLTGTAVVVQAVAPLLAASHFQVAAGKVVQLADFQVVNGKVTPLALFQVVGGKVVRLGVPSVPVTPPASTKPVMGITGGSESAFNDIDALVGPVLIRRTYTSTATLPSSFAAGPAASDVAANRWSVISYRPDPTTFPTDTAAQAAFSAYLDTIPTGHKTTVHVQHEPEAAIAKGTFTLAQYGSTVTVAGQIVRSKNRPELTYGPCFQGTYTFDTRSGYSGYDWHSVIDFTYVDLIGLDPYRTSSGTASLQNQFLVGNSGSSSTATPTMTTLRSWGKPLLLSEWGIFNKPDGSGTTITEAQKIQWIQDGYAWLKSWNAAATYGVIFLGAAYFNYTLIGSDVMLTTAPEQQAYAAIVADSKS